MKLNIYKYKSFTRARNLKKTYLLKWRLFIYYIDGYNLKVWNFFIDLGAIFYSKMSFQHHINVSII